MTAVDLAITVPGVYDMDDQTYHADPIPGGSLSSSGARKLLPPNCPALFKYERDHGRPPKKCFDIGHAAHKLVLGAGPDLVVIDAEEWRSKAVKDQVAAVRAAGKVPLKPSEHAQVQAMAAAIRRHPIAAALFNPDRGQPEQSLFWQDKETGMWRRARLDWLPDPRPGRLIIPDYKSADCANPAKFGRTADNYGYHCQDQWYTDAVRALDLYDDPAFVFVVQETAPPYLVEVVQLDDDSKRVGRDLNRRAIDTYLRCTETGVWPGYSADPTDIPEISLPAYTIRRHEEGLI